MANRPEPSSTHAPDRYPTDDGQTAQAWLNWSSGKDATWALQSARNDDQLDVTGLLTTINAAADRVAMHAVRRELLQAQADEVGLPLHVVELPSPCSNSEYEQRMSQAVGTARRAGVRRFVFGDLALADVRTYREQNLSRSGITPLFPMWGEDTTMLAEKMIKYGLQAVLTCVDPAQLPAEFIGRPYDRQFLQDLPPGVDPCGENGEFHTFVTDGPGFSAPVPVERGEIVERDGFVFADLLPMLASTAML